MSTVPVSPKVIWLTGLPAAGKTTIATALQRELRKQGQHSCLLDGDELRRNGLNADLGFSPADRRENVRRVAHISRILLDAGLMTIVAIVSPFHADRDAARALFRPGEFLEAWVSTPLAVCQRRDPKGLYARARGGQLSEMTGVGQAYEPPESPELVLDGTAPVTDGVTRLMLVLRRSRGYGNVL